MCCGCLRTGLSWDAGDNASGQLGLPKSVKQATKPMQVPGLTDVVELSAGTRHSLARTASGKVYGFGSTKEGQLCLGKPANDAHNYVFAPTEIPLPGAASDISGGGNNTEEDGHSLFLVEGVPYGCGADEEGELGDDSTVIKYTPTVSSELLTLGLTQVATAGETSIGLSISGEVYTWGSDIYGDLSNGSETEPSLSPIPVASGGAEVSATSWNMIYRSPNPPTVVTGTASAVHADHRDTRRQREPQQRRSQRMQARIRHQHLLRLQRVVQPVAGVRQQPGGSARRTQGLGR